MEAHHLRATGQAQLPCSRRFLSAFGDARLVEHVRRGNDAAFEVVYDRHHRSILSYCRHMLGSLAEAEDAVQQTFISAHDSLVRGSREVALKPWLYTIARNRCLSMLRARRDELSYDAELSTAGLSDTVEQRSDLRALLADVAELPDEQRGALVLSELGDLSHAEIADVLGCQVARVKSLVFQARSSLIESRRARETPCEEIRRQLSTLRGGALRRGTLRRHVKSCAGCAEFREQVRRQRAQMAVILPVAPSAGLRESALAMLGMGVGGGGAAAGGGLLAGSGVAKVAMAAAIAGGAGGLAVKEGADLPGTRSHSAPPPAAAPAPVRKTAPVSALGAQGAGKQLHPPSPEKHGRSTARQPGEPSRGPGGAKTRGQVRKLRVRKQAAGEAAVSTRERPHSKAPKRARPQPAPKKARSVPKQKPSVLETPRSVPKPKLEAPYY